MKIITPVTIKLYGGIFIACMISSLSIAQLPVEINLKTPYYVDINHANNSGVYEIQDGLLNLQYYDKSGRSKEVTLKIFNWKMELVGNFNLDKTFGLNNYTIDLKNRMLEIENDKVYFCMLKDEIGNKFEWTFQQIKPVESDLMVDIFVNPVRVSCADYFDNLVEFFGDVKKGVAPYSIRWYVLNTGKSDFVYQPKEELIAASGKTSVIQVDQIPGYHVMLDVTDACGTNAKKMVYLECTESKKKINTLFIEPLDYFNNQAPHSNSNSQATPVGN